MFFKSECDTCREYECICTQNIDNKDKYKYTVYEDSNSKGIIISSAYYNLSIKEMTKDEIFDRYKDVLTKEQIKELYKKLNYGCN